MNVFKLDLKIFKYKFKLSNIELKVFESKLKRFKSKLKVFKRIKHSRDDFFSGKKKEKHEREFGFSSYVMPKTSGPTASLRARDLGKGHVRAN